MGLQLFSVNGDMNADPAGTLRTVVDMGYRDFEVFGFDPETVAYYGLPAAEFRKLLDGLGVTATSGHYGFSDYFQATDDQLRWFTDRCIWGARALGSPYITWPWLAPEYRTRDGYKRLANMLNRIGTQVKDAGLGFAYHNHGFEFEDLGGETGYDIILAETDPEAVKLQMDLYWVVYGGKTTPKQLVADQPGRVVMWHIKDMDPTTRDYSELGAGSINYHNVLPDPFTTGLEFYYIEQGGNFARSPLESARQSAGYFRDNLSRYFDKS